MSDLRIDDRVGSSPTSPDGDVTSPRTRGDARPRRTRRIVGAFSFLTVAAVVGLGVLGVQGYDATRKIKGGATATVITDPAAPGFVAAVDASPVHLLALTDANDALSAFVVAVPDPAGGAGTLVWCMSELVVEVDGAKTSLADLYKNSGLDASRAEFEKVLGFGAIDALIVDPGDLAAVAGSGALTVQNPDPVTVEVKGKKVEKFKAGKLSLDPDELGDYLTVRGAGEIPENRSSRASALLSALIARANGVAAPAGTSAASSTSTAGASTTGSSSKSSTTGTPTTAAPSTSTSAAASSTTVGGVSSSGGPDLASILSAMGTSDPEFVVLPTDRQSFKGSYLYTADTKGIADELEGVVQFPVSSFPGQRPRVRVLNGTSDTTVANGVAPDLALAGGEVLLIGNAKSFDVATSTVVYSNDAFKDVAERIAKVVGVSAQRTEDISDAADIDVVLGADYQR